MKKHILLILISTVSLRVFCQNDTIIHYATEYNDNKDERFDDLKRNWFPGMTEVESMWKLNLLSLNMPYFYLAYEKKLAKRLYYEIGVTAPNILWNTKELGYIYGATGWGDLKFYHGFRKSKKNKERVYSIFGNFVSISLTTYASNLYLDYEQKPRKEDINENIYYKSAEALSGYSNLLIGRKHTKGILIVPTIKYGFQRKLYNVGYFEFSAGYGIGRSFSDSKLYRNFSLQLNVGLDIVESYRYFFHENMK